MEPKKVIVIGGGFGGLATAKKLAGKSNIDVTIIDKTNHHLFQPLLYQVATAALSPGDIATPIRSIFRKNKNIHVMMAEITSVNKEEKYVETSTGRRIEFDYLVIATGARHSYFGHNHWEEHAPGLKTITNALEIRERVLMSLEQAEKEPDLEKRQKFLNFVVVGGGPTGVELAGAFAEITKKQVISDFEVVREQDIHIYLIEGMDSILGVYPEDLREAARIKLKNMGVNVYLNTMVTDINETGVKAGDMTIPSTNVIWAAGNEASPLIKALHTETDSVGRAKVTENLSLPGYPDVFVIGDAAMCIDADGKQVPGIAPAAMQMGTYLAKQIASNFNENKPFTYFDKGMMATIGRAKAVAVVGGMKFKGLFAWLMWSLIHVFFLIGYRNRVRVMAEWIWYYLTFKGSFRLITGRVSDKQNTSTDRQD